MPVILFTGPRGSGKTALLTELKNRLDENVPHARIDCGSFDAGRPWNVLTRLVFDFNLSAAGYRKVPFPRFVTARLVIEEELDLNDLPTAERQVREALARYREAGRLREFLTGLAEELAAAGPGLGGFSGAEGAGRKIAEGVSKALVSWQVLHDEGVTWFGTGAAGVRKLVELNRLTRSANEEDKQEATKRLWAAFLADLRAAFGTGRGARAWSLNCVVLLDDADSRRGVLLLRELTQARRQHAVDHPGEPDPLTVVATASVRTRIVADGPLPAAEEAGYADYESRTGVDSEWYYPVGLRDLTFDEVDAMITSACGGMSNKQLAASVYRFTLGHPAATDVVVDAIVRNGGRTAPLKTLLQVRLPTGAQDVTAEEKILRLFVEETSGTSFEKLVTCSAARNIEQAEYLSRSDADLVVPPELRTSSGATMLPVLRHLLLRRLADDTEKWSWAHQWLRDNGEEDDRLYHALAGRDVASVTTWLVDRLGDTKMDEWLAALYSITAAPNDLDCDDADPDEVLATVGWTEPEDGLTAAVARLVAALWLAHDPVSHADRHKLYRAVEEELRVLRQTVRQGRATLGAETERFTGMAGDPHNVDLSVDGRPRPVAGPGVRPESLTFTLPVTEAERRRRKRRGVLVAAGVVVALVAGFLAVWFNSSSCDKGVTAQGGECVGVTDGSYVFDDRLAEVEAKILAENERVDSEGHVTLALLTPMIPSETGSSTWERIRAQLEGAHAAQLTANEEDKWPKVKLVLAHPGSDQQAWEQVVGQLVEMTDAPERLVGVIGLVPSSPITQQMMRALAAANLPMVATLVTATNINESRVEGFARVSSTTHDQVTVLSDHLGTATPRKAMLVFDSDEKNLFGAALRDDFKAVAPARANLEIIVESEYDTEAALPPQLKSIMGDLCGAGAPDTILYAARAELFDELVVNVRERNCARDRVITVVSGSDASVLRARDDLKPNSRDDNAPTVILYTPLVDPDALRQDGVAEFDQLAAQFAELGFGAADLADGWAVITHDGVLAATEAITRAGAGRGGELPSNTDVRFELGRTDRERNQVRGASGTFTLDAETGNVVGRRLPVVEVDQNWTFTVKGIYDAGLR